MLRQDQIERLRALGEDQLAIAEKWEREREERGRHLDAMVEADKNKDAEAYTKAFEAFLAADEGAQTGRCEHDRSIWTPCGGCEEIEQALNPEFYDENGDRLEDGEIEAIINANPERYGSWRYS